MSVNNNSIFGLYNKHSFSLPSLNWFLPDPDNDKITNSYTGSLGTCPNTGFICKSIFEYKVESVPKEKALKVTCRERKPWNSNAPSRPEATRLFDLSEKGLREATLWVMKMAEEILEKGD